MTALSSSSVSSLKELGIIVFCAAIGGIVVLIGLVKEYKWEKDWYSDINDLRKSKLRRKGGEIWVIVGVALEVIIGIGFASHEWDEAKQTAINIKKNNPLKKPLAFLSASVTLRLLSTNIQDSNWVFGTPMYSIDSMRLTFAKRPGAGIKADLICQKADRGANGHILMLSANFEMETFAPMKQWLASNTVESVGQWNVCDIDLTALCNDRNAILASGSIVLTANTTQYEFDLPVVTNRMPFGANFDFPIHMNRIEQ